MRALFLACAIVLAAALLQAAPARAQSTPALGFRAGVSRSPDHTYLGLQGEFGLGLGGARLAPSLDWGLGDHTVTILNADLRWYLLPLPETGLRIYGAAGPGLVLDPGTELGFNLSVGLHIPMKSGRRYNVEARFGFGDVPDFKIGASLLFGL